MNKKIGMNENLQEKYILSTYRNKSITKAASELGISQPAMSSAINNIEKKLGFRIFERRQTPICPTEEGKVYIEYLKKHQQEYHECFQKINDMIKNKNLKLTVGTPALYASTYLPEAIARFHKQYPECRIMIKVAALPELLGMSEEGQIDCFICTSDTLDADFAAEPIMREKIYLCIPKDWPVNRKLEVCQEKLNQHMGNEEPGIASVNWKALAGQELIALDENQPLQKEIERFLSREKLCLKKKIIVNQVSVGAELAAQGLGMMFMSGEAVKGCKNQESLRLYPLPGCAGSRFIYIAYNKCRYMSQMCSHFIETLRGK